MPDLAHPWKNSEKRKKKKKSKKEKMLIFTKVEKVYNDDLFIPLRRKKWRKKFTKGKNYIEDIPFFFG